MSLDTLNEAFKRLDMLNEDMFDMSLDGINKLDSTMEDDVADTIDVIDAEANTEDDVKDSYIGKVIINCNVCHSHIFSNKEDINIDDSGIVNGEEACPYCGEQEGFTIVGKIERFEVESDDNCEDDDEEISDVSDEQETETTDETDEVKTESFRKRGSSKRLVESGKSVDINKLSKVKKKLGEASDVTDQVTISVKETGFLTKKKELEKQGYKVLHTGNGQITMAKPKALAEAYTIECPEGGKNYYIRKDVDLDAPPSDAYDWFTNDPKKAMTFNDKQSAVKFWKDYDLGCNVFAVGDDGYQVEPDDYIVKLTEGLSYGELNAIENEWRKFKRARGVVGKADPSLAWEFIDTECKGVYDTDDDRTDVFGVISSLEEKFIKESATKLPKRVSIKASELAADTDDEGVILDAVSDYLSDTYGYCHYGFSLDIKKNEDGEPSVITVSNIEWDTSESLKGSKKLNEAPYLEPYYDARQSFYNKAFVNDEDDTLYSYGTKVMEIRDGKPVITCRQDQISQTTLRHIKEFLKQHGFAAISKQQIIRDYMTEGKCRKTNCKVLSEDAKIICELGDYEPWSGAVDTWDTIRDNDAVEALDSLLEELYPDGIGMTELNDLLWFESDWVLESLGLSEDEEVDECLKSKNLKEDINNISVDTDDQHLTISQDDNGKFTVTTEPISSSNNEGTTDTVVTTDTEDGATTTDAEDGDEVVAQISDDEMDSMIGGETETAEENSDEVADTEVGTDGEETTEDETSTDTEGEAATDDTTTEGEESSEDLLDSLSIRSRKLMRESVLKEADGEEDVDASFKAIVSKLQGIKQYDSFVKTLSGLSDEQKKVFMNNFGEYDEITPNVQETSTLVTELFPSQSAIGLENSLNYALKEDCSKFFSGSAVTIVAPVLTYKNQFIIDGHHRWSQAYMINPECEINCTNFDYAQNSATDVLKDFQGAILATTGTIKTEEALHNVYSMSEDEIRKYISDFIQDVCWKSIVKAGKAQDKEGVIEYIVKNTMLLKSKNKPKGGAPDREIMPQVDTASLDKMKDGFTDMSESVSVDFSDFDEKAFDTISERYLKRVYENVDSFSTTSVHCGAKKLIVEGAIKFKSGVTKKTGFIFESDAVDSKGRVRFTGSNKHFSDSEKAFSLMGKISEGSLKVESLSYNYKSKGSSDRIVGRVKSN